MTNPIHHPLRVRGRLCETGEIVQVEVEDGRIARVGRVEETTSAPDLGAGTVRWLAPGFLDLQVNGYGGVDLTGLWGGGDAGEALPVLAASLAAAGTTRFLPTVVTNREETLSRSFRAMARALDADPALAKAAPAFHLEGPWIATEDGPRGAHVLDYVRDPDLDEFARLQEAAGGRIRLVTLAPERPGALAAISCLTEQGVTVALGHTGASPETIRDAVLAGASLSTHLGNGSHAMLPRHTNYLWEQMAHDGLTATVIADSHHLPPAALKCIARVKGAARLVLVSDAVALGGMPPGIYAAGRYEVLPSGKVILAGTPYLAGAGHLLDTCIAHAFRTTDLSLGDAVRAATENAARAMGWGERLGRIRVGAEADLTLFEVPDAGPLAVCATVRAGEVVYRG